MSSLPNRGVRARPRTFYLVLAGLMAVFAALLSPLAAEANLAGSSFEGGDGNFVVNTSGNSDWASIASSVNTGVDKPTGSTDNAFGQGTKEDNAATSVVTGSIPPNKNDLTQFYEASQLGSNGHIYLMLGWERLVNIGNANLDFEINQAKTAGFTASATGPVTLNRTAGDLLVTYDFGGSGTPTLGLNTWLTGAAGNTVAQCYSANALPCWGKHIALGGGTAEGAVNTSSVTDTLQDPDATLGAGLFGEANIDLTAAGVFPADTCEAFGSAFVKSRSSSSFTAELKDFIAPIPVNISNCGTIVVHKVTENGDGSFGYTTTGALTPSTFSLSNGGSRTYTNLQAGSYSITENLTPAQVADGWTLRDLSCTATGSDTSASSSGATASISMGLGGLVDCTYTNHVKLTPSIATTLSDTSVEVGSSVHDSASLTGASANAGGTVAYTVYSDSSCSQGARDAGTVTVANGSVPDSNALSFGTAGDFYWQAAYSGDSNNNAATSACTEEHLVVTKKQPSVSTAQDLIPNDTFTLSGATSGAGGTVTFKLFSPSDTTCSGTPALTETLNVNGNGSYSTSNASFHSTAEGTWRWLSTYSGDTDNRSATSACGTERFTITNN